MKSRPVRAIIAPIALLLVAEGVLRVVGIGDPVLLRADPCCGYLLRPNQDHFRFFVHTRVNSHSMRCDEFSEKKAPRVYRVMFLGDSMTYGTTRVNQSDIFTEVLHRELPSILHRPVEVLNASANAWAIGNELGYLESHGLFSADSVVLVLNNGDLTQPTSEVSDVGSTLHFEKPACALCELLGRYRKRAKRDSGSNELDDPSQARKNLKLLDELRDFVLARGSRMLILFVPFPHDLKRANLVLLQPALSGWARDHDVKIIDATASLAPLSIRQASVDGGTHLSVEGNRAVANCFERAAPAALDVRVN